MCMSNENGPLVPIGGYVNAIKAIKSDPNRVLVSAIAGPATPYKVNVGPAQLKGDPSMWPYVEHSCVSLGPDLSYADPAVRIKQWTDAFGTNGLFQSLCSTELTGELQAIAAQVWSAIGPPCLPATVDPGKCSFSDNPPSALGLSTPLRSCASSADVGPCWYAKTDATACGAGHEIVFNRPTTPPAGTSTTVSCSVN
jgi:hypothetical protein